MASDRPQSESQLPAVRAEGGGFRATIDDAGLWDLVQLNCDARTRCAVSIRSGARSGYLYFADGQIVHAVAGGLIGERAALEILSWRSGSWQSTDGPWPVRPSVTTPWQGLLLRAAQMQDEAARPRPLIAVGVPPPEPAPEPRRAALSAPAPEPAPARASTPAPAKEHTSQEASGLSYRPQDFEHVVRLDAQGTVNAGHGRVEELAALAAYVCRVGDLIGELLGLDKLVGLDASLARGAHCLIFRNSHGHTIALRPRQGVDLTQLKNQLRL
jgi:hypothetical protein